VSERLWSAASTHQSETHGLQTSDHKDRAAVAAKARAAALEKFKTAPEPTPEELAARAERAAAAEEKRLAAIAASAAKREAQRQAVLDARAAKEAAKLEELNRIILSEEILPGPDPDAAAHYWAAQGCVILQPYDMEVGAGTFHPAHAARASGRSRGRPPMCSRRAARRMAAMARTPTACSTITSFR
jgi:hypothetical protein